MSNPCSRLRSILKSNVTKTTILRNKKGIIIADSGNIITVKTLAEETNLDELAKKIKQIASQSVKFRNRINIYDVSISRLAHAKRFNLIEDILDSHKHFPEITSEGFAMRLISLYARAGMFDHARKLFDELPQLNCQRTVKSFNALLQAGVKSQRFDDVLSIFREFPAKLKLTCDVISYNTIIHAHCKMGSLDEALLLLDEMKKKGMRRDIVTFNTLLGPFYRVKGLDGGDRIWAMMHEYYVLPNIASYNFKMQALVNHGELEKAASLYETFESKGLKPNVNTFNVLIKGFCDQGDVEEIKKSYNALLESGNSPNSITFSTLAPKLCDSGDLDLAFQLCKKMFRRRFVVDEALLQLVVNKLFEGGMTDEATKIVELGKSNTYFPYSLVLPSDDAKN